LPTTGLVAEYTNGIKWLSQTTHRKNLILFIGSNIGNFSWQQSKHFLQSLWNWLNPDDYVMIGFDLKKDIDLLVSAYNDSAGITRDFNLNLLDRINKELGGNFNLRQFRHYEPYNVWTGAMESYLVSEKRQTVFIKELSMYFNFETLEPIHVESSHKYSESDIRHLAGQTGFMIEHMLYDSKKYFVDSVWRVQKADQTISVFYKHSKAK
ncbi:MAG: L-histidine N(alpha)-methyltransferase, partial [Chlorobiales bacterium]|nr:L-histidine N(alpha)-methyltransferase [Chlorobiales bacterium]